MKYAPNYIIYTQALSYLSEKEKVKITDKLYEYNVRKKRFLNCLKRNFDIEVFIKDPLIPEDEMLYNYIKFEAIKKVKRNGLIAVYARIAFLENDEEFCKKNNIKYPIENKAQIPYQTSMDF